MSVFFGVIFNSFFLKNCEICMRMTVMRSNKRNRKGHDPSEADDAGAFDISGFLETLDVPGEKSEDKVLVEGAIEHSKSYAHHRCAIIRSFLETLSVKGM